MKNLSFKFLMPLVLFVTFGLVLNACSGESDTTDYALEEEREEMTSQLEELRDDIDDQLSELQTRIERAGDEAGRENFDEAYEELTGQRDAVDRALADVRNATSDTWSTVSSAASDTFDDVSSKFEQWQDDVGNLMNDINE